MRRVPADRRKPACSRQRHCQLPPTRQLRSKLHVSERAEQPQKPDRMRQPSQRRDQRGSNPIDSPPSPQNRQSKASQPQRQVVVHETHVEGIAVGQHGDAGREKPRRALRYRGNKRENAPEENQHASGNNNLLRRGKAHKIRRSQQRHIKQNIVPLLRDVKSRRLSLFDQLRKPRVIGMARQIPRLDAPVPHARNENQRGNRDNPPSGKSPARREFAFILGKNLSQSETSLHQITPRGILLSSSSRRRPDPELPGLSAPHTRRNRPRAAGQTMPQNENGDQR